MLRALVLGAVQGLTEFVPVSSSAHLVLVPFVLGWPIPGLPFDVAVHLGTAAAVVAYFWREILAIVTGTVRTAARRGNERDRASARLAGLLAMASIPAGLAGLLFERPFESLYDRPGVSAGLLLVTALLLLGGEAAFRRLGAGHGRDLNDVRLLDALAVGVLQAAAIAPGISRSGATIAAGLFRGLGRDAAARFSFLLGLPAILGAGLLKVGDVPSGAGFGLAAAATLVSAVSGFAAIAFLLRHLRRGNTRPFAYYCVLVGALALVYGVVTR